MDLSIIVPVYNTEKFLEECLLTIFKSGVEINRFEVIVVNDGSTDNSFSIIKKYAQLYPNISVINQPNMGLSKARNNALKIATGKYILFLDADDYLINIDSLFALLDTAILHNLEMIRFEYLGVDECGHKLFDAPNLEKKRIYENKIENGLFLLEHIYQFDFYACIFLFQRHFISNSGVLFKEGAYFEDIEFVLNLSLMAKKTLYRGETLYAYRQHSSSIVHTFSEKKVNDVIELTASVRKLINKNKSLSAKIIQLLRNNETRLLTTVLLRIADSSLYPCRKKLYGLFKKNDIKKIYLTANAKEFIIALLFNIFGQYVINILHPFVLLKTSIKNGK